MAITGLLGMNELKDGRGDRQALDGGKQQPAAGTARSDGAAIQLTQQLHLLDFQQQSVLAGLKVSLQFVACDQIDALEQLVAVVVVGTRPPGAGSSMAFGRRVRSWLQRSGMGSASRV